MIMEFVLATHWREALNHHRFFKERDCAESLQSLTANKQNKNSSHDVLRKYHNKRLGKHQTSRALYTRTLYSILMMLTIFTGK